MGFNDKFALQKILNGPCPLRRVWLFSNSVRHAGFGGDGCCCVRGTCARSPVLIMAGHVETSLAFPLQPPTVSFFWRQKPPTVSFFWRQKCRRRHSSTRPILAAITGSNSKAWGWVDGTHRIFRNGIGFPDRNVCFSRQSPSQLADHYPTCQGCRQSAAVHLSPLRGGYFFSPPYPENPRKNESGKPA
jgi:hypothetical protein